MNAVTESKAEFEQHLVEIYGSPNDKPQFQCTWSIASPPDRHGLHNAIHYPAFGGVNVQCTLEPFEQELKVLLAMEFRDRLLVNVWTVALLA